MITLDKSKRGNHYGEFLKPSTRGLLEPIQSFAKPTNLAWSMLNSWRRGHINLFMRVTIQKGILDIHLKDLPLSNGCNCNHSTNCRHLCNWGKCLLVVKTILLGIPFCYKSSLISFNRATIFCFYLLHLTTNYHIFPRRKRNRVPCMSLMKSSEFFSHNIQPKRI